MTTILKTAGLAALLLGLALFSPRIVRAQAPNTSRLSGCTADRVASATAVVLPGTRPSRVEIYRDAALVTRSKNVLLKDGAYRLEFPNLPEALVKTRVDLLSSDPRIEVCGPVTVITTGGKPDDECVRILRAQEEAVNGYIDELNDDFGMLDDQQQWLDGATGVLQNGEDPDNRSTEARPRRIWDGFNLEFEKRDGIRYKRDYFNRLKSAYVDLKNNLAKARKRCAESSPVWRRASVVVIVGRSDARSSECTPVTIALSYAVEAVTWEPKLHLRVKTETSPAASRASLELIATVTQATGEDWQNVQYEVHDENLLTARTPSPLGRMRIIQPTSPNQSAAQDPICTPRAPDRKVSIPSSKDKKRDVHVHLLENLAVRIGGPRAVVRIGNTCNAALPEGDMNIYWNGAMRQRISVSRLLRNYERDIDIGL